MKNIRTKSHANFKVLMSHLESSGYRWYDGYLPTDGFDRWHKHKRDTVVVLDHKNKKIGLKNIYDEKISLYFRPSNMDKCEFILETLDKYGYRFDVSSEDDRDYYLKYGSNSGVIDIYPDANQAKLQHAQTWIRGTKAERKEVCKDIIIPSLIAIALGFLAYLFDAVFGPYFIFYIMMFSGYVGACALFCLATLQITFYILMSMSWFFTSRKGARKLDRVWFRMVQSEYNKGTI